MWHGLLVCVPLLLFACSESEAAPVEPVETAGPVEPVGPPTEFIRFVERGPQKADLETAIVSYSTGDGATVDLIGMVHMADASYYARLDKSFDGYDAVLYEMIKPEEAEPTGGEDTGSALSMIQRGISRALELEFQLTSLDYGRANFVHADLTTEEFGRLWRERDESVLRLLLRMMSASAGQTSSLTPAALFDAARSEQRAAKLKLLLGKEFSQLERTLAGLGEIGEDGRDNSMLLGARNAAAVDALRTRLAAGDRRIAIIYGAAHGPDLDLRLTTDLELTRRSVRWLTAWQIDATQD